VPSIVKDDIPSISFGSMPQSWMAARRAAQPGWSSERPEFVEY
jgi:hypothetical protein